jgi:hypothetical protein
VQQLEKQLLALKPVHSAHATQMIAEHKHQYSPKFRQNINIECVQATAYVPSIINSFANTSNKDNDNARTLLYSWHNGKTSEGKYPHRLYSTSFVYGIEHHYFLRNNHRTAGLQERHFGAIITTTTLDELSANHTSNRNDASSATTSQCPLSFLTSSTNPDYAYSCWNTNN